MTVTRFRPLVAASVLVLALSGCAGTPKDDEGTTQSDSGTGAPAQEGEGTTQSDPETTAPQDDVFTSESGSFSVVFPGKPSVQPISEEAENALVSGAIYVYEKNVDEAYMVTESTVELSDPNASWSEEGALEGAITGMYSAVGGTVVEQNLNETFAGLPAASIYFTVEQEGKSYDFRAIVAIDDKTSYQVATVGTDQAAFEAFADTFRINN